MPIPHTIRAQFGVDGMKVLEPFFNRLTQIDELGSAPDVPQLRAIEMAALALTAKAIGEIDGNLHDHKLNQTQITSQRVKGEEHLPVSLYPDNLKNREDELKTKLGALIGEDRATATAKRVTEYAQSRLEESKRLMESGD